MPNFIDISNINLKKNYSKIALGVLVMFIVSTYVISLLGFVSPSQTLRWNGGINYINGAAFSPGDQVLIEAYIEEGDTYFNKGFYYFFTGAENIRWIVNVMDEFNNPVYFETGNITSAYGDIALPEITFDLSDSAAVGTYTVKVIIWTDWLPAGLSRTNTIETISFEVV